MKKPLLTGLVFFSGILLMQPLLLHAQNKIPYNPRTHTDRIIVKFKAEKSASGISSTPPTRSLQTSRNLRLQYRRNMADQSQVWSLGQPLELNDVRRIAAELMLRDDIEYAEPDARRFPAFTPNDAAYGSQWYLFESAGGIRAQQAWDITRGNSGTVTAVIDSGITTHSELTRLLPGYDFVSEDSAGVFDTANDGDGRDNDPGDPGDATEADECEPDTPAASSSWHGTLVAGIIIAETNNNSGIAGIDHNGYVLPIRALGKCGGYISDITDAIRWAAGASIPNVPANANRAHVINLSLGGEGACSITEQNAINAAVANNAVVVVAAGNEGIPITHTPGDEDRPGSSPANCNNVIAVTATTRQGAETFYTNFGSETDISAPGGNSPTGTNSILSASNNGVTSPTTEGFAFAIGTSFSAPMVSAAAALLKGLNPAATPQQIEAILKNTARPFPTGTSDGFADCTTSRCGAGILDIHAAVTEIINNPPSASTTTSTLTSTGSGAITWLLPLLITTLFYKRRKWTLFSTCYRNISGT